jgi:hypothetical protein
VLLEQPAWLARLAGVMMKVSRHSLCKSPNPHVVMLAVLPACADAPGLLCCAYKILHVDMHLCSEGVRVASLLEQPARLARQAGVVRLP